MRKKYNLRISNNSTNLQQDALRNLMSIVPNESLQSEAIRVCNDSVKFHEKYGFQVAFYKSNLGILRFLPYCGAIKRDAVQKKIHLHLLTGKLQITLNNRKTMANGGHVIIIPSGCAFSVENLSANTAIATFLLKT